MPQRHFVSMKKVKRHILYLLNFNGNVSNQATSTCPYVRALHGEHVGTISRESVLPRIRDKTEITGVGGTCSSVNVLQSSP